MRSIWKGAIAFGLVNIPIRLYSASRSKELSFKLLHKKDNSEIRYARICKAEDKEVPWKDIVKGYEYQKGDYVVLTDEDFKKADPKKNQMIEILDFTDENQINSVYYDTPYYLEPEKGAQKAYHLLKAALTKSKKVGIGTFVLRQRAHIAVIKLYGDILVLNQLRYASELVNPDELKVPQEADIGKKEVDMAIQLIDQLTKPFNPAAYKDTYVEEMQDIIEKKAKGQKITVPKGEAPKSTKIIDMMSLLKESLEKQKKKAPPKPKKRKTA